MWTSSFTTIHIKPSIFLMKEVTFTCVFKMWFLILTIYFCNYSDQWFFNSTTDLFFYLCLTLESKSYKIIKILQLIDIRGNEQRSSWVGEIKQSTEDSKNGGQRKWFRGREENTKISQTTCLKYQNCPYICKKNDYLIPRHTQIIPSFLKIVWLCFSLKNKKVLFILFSYFNHQ